mmetsp:Transcript_33816/g.53774  ORF Transcript_33816/g.53774 Transcript_33816/m.53774 type:complete len:234 (-) Transcript_33816:1154-1855(-)
MHRAQHEEIALYSYYLTQQFHKHLHQKTSFSTIPAKNVSAATQQHLRRQSPHFCCSLSYFLVLPTLRIRAGLCRMRVLHQHPQIRKLYAHLHESLTVVIAVWAMHFVGLSQRRHAQNVRTHNYHRGIDCHSPFRIPHRRTMPRQSLACDDKSATTEALAQLAQMLHIRIPISAHHHGISSQPLHGPAHDLYWKFLPWRAEHHCQSSAVKLVPRLQCHRHHIAIAKALTETKKS